MTDLLYKTTGSVWIVIHGKFRYRMLPGQFRLYYFVWIICCVALWLVLSLVIFIWLFWYVLKEGL